MRRKVNISTLMVFHNQRRRRRVVTNSHEPTLGYLSLMTVIFSSVNTWRSGSFIELSSPWFQNGVGFFAFGFSDSSPDFRFVPPPVAILKQNPKTFYNSNFDWILIFHFYQSDFPVSMDGSIIQLFSQFPEKFVFWNKLTRKKNHTDKTIKK